MAAIFKREFKSYFSGMMGWVLTGVMLLFGGIYFTAANLQGGYTDFTITLYSFVIVLLVFIPLLTMRSFAEEKRARTDQLLLTSPVSVPGIVLG
ncbi:ABC transporter permease, partial [Allofournierella sp.]